MRILYTRILYIYIYIYALYTLVYIYIYIYMYIYKYALDDFISGLTSEISSVKTLCSVAVLVRKT